MGLKLYQFCKDLTLVALLPLQDLQACGAIGGYTRPGKMWGKKRGKPLENRGKTLGKRENPRDIVEKT